MKRSDRNAPVADIPDREHNIAMPAKKPRTPQQKKALSLDRDHRNTYGNNQKAARKAIPLRKALENRKVRHKNNRAISQAVLLGEDALDVAESSARHDVYRLGGWKKSSDEPLGVVVGRSLKARKERVDRKIRARFPYRDGS